jgi:hypothetical protein
VNQERSCDRRHEGVCFRERRCLSGVWTERNPGVKKAVAEVESREAMLRSGSRRGSLSVNTDSPWQECGVDPHDVSLSNRLLWRFWGFGSEAMP